MKTCSTHRSRAHAPLPASPLAAIPSISHASFSLSTFFTTSPRLRIQRAARLLTQPLAHVTNPALDAGFDNSGGFAQQFRTIMNMPPRAHIARLRALLP